jgi:hypothetical protein
MGDVIMFLGDDLKLTPKFPKTSGRVFIRDPWATYIMLQEKWIETAHIALPERFRDVWLDVQTDRRELVGIVRFTGSYEYESAEHFDRDYPLHKVAPGSDFYFGKRRHTWAWEIEFLDAFAYDAPIPADPMKSQFRLELY